MNENITYECTFYGRQNGAIGIFHQNRVIVTVPNGPNSKEAARLKLYDMHEHIQLVQFRVIETTGL